MSAHAMTRLPHLVLRGVGVACTALAGMGLWYSGSTLRTHFDPGLGEPYFYHAFYTMSALCILSYFALAATGLQLIRLKHAWVRVLGVVVIFEIVFFFSVGFSWTLPTVGQSVAAATGVANGGLMFQLVTLFPIWGPLLAHWARRRIEHPDAVIDPFAEQERVARSSDWLWAGVNVVVLFIMVVFVSGMLWGRAFPGTFPPGYLTLLAFGIAVVNGFASVRSRRKKRGAKIAERRRHRLARGLCPRCEYNLTGNASGDCPECGCRP